MLLCPVVHHALRHAAIDMPDMVRVSDPLGDGSHETHAMVSISPRWGGLLVERAWESITRDLGHLERWNALLSRARAAVMYYISVHGVPTLRAQLAGTESWPFYQAVTTLPKAVTPYERVLPFWGSFGDSQITE